MIAYPGHNQKYCDKCGAPTITNCQGCGTAIKGSYHVQGVFGIDDSPSPSFCHNCGKSYPWTEAKIKAAQELTLELDNLTQEEKENLNKSINDIIRDTPETTVSATRVKKLFAKAGKGAAESFRNILVDIICEAAKKMIWP
ncbi:MAG: DUF2321 domain-containing protein [Planctomycetia bacterium]|nr:DUF2321 domain-containing protein [Candidatus Brocadia sp.]QOJ07847.1 MAG: DUF2321 domain-containing protein [Planctomycetia bacterium]TVL98142.1 MAG: DUF2321 domain-containing protein [Candidatus Brocadia sp. BL1]